MLTVIIVLAILILVPITVSHIKYHRSLIATLIEMVCSKYKDKRSEDETLEILRQKKSEKEPFYHFDKKMKWSVSEETYQNLRIFTVNANEHTPIFVYIHGGGYTAEIGDLSWLFVKQTIKKSGCEIRAIIYPLAPWHTFEESYPSITDYYAKLRKNNPNRPILLCGDSAGGGLALGIAINVIKKGLVAPEGLVLLSPWVDATEENPDIPPYEKEDPLLATGPLRASAKSWAGEYPLKDWHVSPINGDLRGLKNVNIFVGTHEMFYPDDVLLYEKLKALGISTTLTVGLNMNHCYPAFPIPEGSKAVTKIADMIKKCK